MNKARAHESLARPLAIEDLERILVNVANPDHIRKAAGNEIRRRRNDAAWWCPECAVGVELGEEAWEGFSNVSGPALHFECGEELEAV